MYMWYFNCTIEAPEASEQPAKKIEGAALAQSSSRQGLCALDAAKNDLPANPFLLCILPQKCNEFTPAF